MTDRTVILGISCFYHDSAAALIVDGKVIAAAQEERFTRVRHDSSFPRAAAQYCLDQAGFTITDVRYVVFYEKPLLKFERLVRSYINTWPKGLVSFVRMMLSWSGSKFWIERSIRSELAFDGDVLWVEHHMAHAAASYYTAPVQRAAIVVVDGVGERDTTTIGYAQGNSIRLTKTVTFPHSLGLLYSAFTYYLGFRVNDDEYKVMGLAPYGDPARYASSIEKLVEWSPDGSYRLSMEYFGYEYGSRMITRAFESLFDGPVRTPESELTQRHKDIAAALQYFLNGAMLRIAEFAAKECGERVVCLSGGVALNCVANGTIAESALVDQVFVPPSPGDSGGALGAALYVYHDVLGFEKTDTSNPYLGPSYTDDEIRAAIEVANSSPAQFTFRMLSDSELCATVAPLIEGNTAVGWFQGRMEFGPRALGNRSILADPRAKDNWQRINQKIKFRETFRPLAPSVLERYAGEYFDMKGRDGRHMMCTARVLKSTIPAVTHVDNSARVHVVHEASNPRFYKLLAAFHEKTGCPVLVNTSLNVRGEPMIMTPQEAVSCFLNTQMDHLVVGNWLLSKSAMIEPL